jgi:ubiquinone/menaquinone biosynthesis C-methylase UbiE
LLTPNSNIKEIFNTKSILYSPMSYKEAGLKKAIREKWDESSASYDNHHGHGIKTDEEHEAWIKALERIIPSGSVKVLDVGCGTGAMSLLLAEMGHQVTGVDLSEKMLDKARSKAKADKLKARFERGDAEALVFKESSFDLVINRHLLWTLPKPDIALKEWRRVLNDGGKAVVIDGLWNDGSINHKARRLLSDFFILVQERRNPRKSGYGKEVDCVLPHPRGMSTDRARAYFDGAGFADLDLTVLNDIRDIQKKQMPISQKITYDFVYYMISGTKSGR